MKKPMKNLIVILILSILPNLIFAQFTPSDNGLTIIVTDGTNHGKKSLLQPPSDVRLQDPIRPLGMTDAIQAGAFLERPQYGITGYLLIFCVNDSIGDQQGTLNVKGQIMFGVYRLIRQKLVPNEAIPEGMTPFRLSGTVYFLGIS
jgi:hypothetical protein